ncbi:MAG TPA: SDR family NAD(P)-dependent oxidoreductase [Spirochaetia bacterium]|nr:SDR family NAD(P)-dependent oxidoreductase [Spirochaetia bacterium]
MTPKWCLITGGNSGIGKAAAIQLAAAGHKVTIGCRSAERGEHARQEIRELSDGGSVELALVDMSSRTSIRRFAELFAREHPRLDVLIHNAAEFDVGRTTPAYTEEDVESVWATNHLGPVLLTQLLLALLHAGDKGRIITIASKGLVMYPRLRVELEDPEFRRARYSVQKAYYQAKLAQVMYTYWLARQLEGTDLTANCIRVTNVKVDIDRYPDLTKFSKFLYSIKSKSSITPEKMAEAYVALATSPEFAGISGGYFDENCRPVRSSAYSREPANIEAMMKLTNRYLALR